MNERDAGVVAPDVLEVIRAHPFYAAYKQRTFELLGPADVEPLGAPALKGKSVPVAVYELNALHEPVAAADS